MEKQSKINLIYVASIGRSGTTLFESILGAHSQMDTCGEVHIWPHEIMQGGVQPCGSGYYVQECPFWTEMRAKADPLEQPAPRIHFFREQHNAGKTLRTERLREFDDTAVSGEIAEQVRTYGENNHSMFRAFAEEVEEKTGRSPEWIVDSSKDLYRLLWLVRSGLFNVKVFHLVRNPRAFMYSVTKDWIHSNDALSGLNRIHYTLRQALAWVIRNHLIAKIAENHLDAQDYALIHYEDLAAQPKETFEQVCRVVGCEYEEQAVDNFREGSPFAIAGNPMRYEDRDIELDERWKKHLPLSSRKLTEFITLVNRSQFGYD